MRKLTATLRFIGIATSIALLLGLFVLSRAGRQTIRLPDSGTLALKRVETGANARAPLPWRISYYWSGGKPPGATFEWTLNSLGEFSSQDDPARGTQRRCRRVLSAAELQPLADVFAHSDPASWLHSKGTRVVGAHPEDIDVAPVRDGDINHSFMLVLGDRTFNLEEARGPSLTGPEMQALERVRLAAQAACP